MRVTFVSASAVAFAHAGVFSHFALAANLRVVVDVEVLRLSVSGLLYLQDDTVPLTLGKGGSGNKCVTSFFEIERSFAGRSFRR